MIEKGEIARAVDCALWIKRDKRDERPRRKHTTKRTSYVVSTTAVINGGLSKSHGGDRG